MNPFGNNANAHGARQLDCSEDPPGPSTFNPMPSLLSDPGHDHPLYDCSMAMPMASLQLYSLPSLPDLGEFEELDCPDDLFTLFGSQTDTDLEYGHGSSISMVSSLGSAYSCPSITSAPEQQGEDPEGLANLGRSDSVDGLGSWFPACGDRQEHLFSLVGESRDSICQAKPVLAAKIAAIENNVAFDVDGCGINPGVEFLLPVERRSGKFGCMPASACHGHRLTSREVATRHPDRFKGVIKNKNSDKWTCEIRISTKILKDIKLRKDKLWLGTFPTRYQAAKALDVGRYLLSVKKFNTPPETFFEINSQTFEELKKFKGCLHAQPLTAELLRRVKELAEHYGKHDSLQGFLF